MGRSSAARNSFSYRIHFLLSSSFLEGFARCFHGQKRVVWWFSCLVAFKILREQWKSWESRRKYGTGNIFCSRPAFFLSHFFVRNNNIQHHSSLLVDLVTSSLLNSKKSFSFSPSWSSPFSHLSRSGASGLIFPQSFLSAEHNSNPTNASPKRSSRGVIARNKRSRTLLKIRIRLCRTFTGEFQLV